MITLDQLPLAELKRHLESEWQPAPSVLLPGVLQGSGQQARGSFTITFDGTVSRITTTKPHGLPRIPDNVQAIASRPSGQQSLIVDLESKDGTNVVLSAVTRDVSNPPAGTVYTIYWVAWA